MWIPENEAIQFLNSRLKLPATGSEQDWEIELSDHTRLDEFINYLAENALTAEVKKALAALILSSFEDAFWSEIFSTVKWERFEAILLAEFTTYQSVIRSWLGEMSDEPNGIEFYIVALLDKAKK